jgi:hypothetical protein
MQTTMVPPGLADSMKQFQASLTPADFGEHLKRVQTSGFAPGLDKTRTRLQASLVSPELARALTRVEAAYTSPGDRSPLGCLTSVELDAATIQFQTSMMARPGTEAEPTSAPQGITISDVEYFTLLVVFFWALAAKLNDFDSAGTAITQLNGSQIVFAAVEVCGVPLLAISILRLLASWIKR